MQHRGTECVKGAAAGAAAGVIAGWVMNRVQAAISGRQRPHGGQAPRTGGAFATRSEERFPAHDNAATKVAAVAAETLADEELTAPERERGGAWVHYLFAGGAGAVYGLLASCIGVRGVGAGAAYGALIWVGANVMVLPGLALSKPAHQYTPREEGASLAGHLVYGVTTELVRRAVRGAAWEAAAGRGPAHIEWRTSARFLFLLIFRLQPRARRLLRGAS